MRYRPILPLVLLLASGAAPALPGHPVAVTTAPVAVDEREFAGSRLRFMGGIAISAADKDFGGLSGLRWRKDRLYAVSDGGGWAELVPVEADGRLTSVTAVRIGPLLDTDGTALTGKEAGDAEALTEDAQGGGWVVSMERSRRFLRYKTLDAVPYPARLRAEVVANVDLSATRAADAPYAASDRLLTSKVLGDLEPNRGVEAIATAGSYLICAQRAATDVGNCATVGGYSKSPFAVKAPPPLEAAVPSDADTTSRYAFVMLRVTGKAPPTPDVAIVSTDPESPPIAVFSAPDHAKLEGLAYRRAGSRDYLYIVADNDFSDRPTILLKFELLRR